MGGTGRGKAHFAWHARGGCGEINGLFENGWGRKQVDSAVVSRAGVEGPGS